MGVYSQLAGQDNQQMNLSGVIVCMKEKGQSVPSNADIIYPYFILTLTLSGTAHALYDMREMHSRKNDLTLFLPGHIIRPLDHSEDYTQAWLLMDPMKFTDSELKFSTGDLDLFEQAPLIHLTDEQVANLLSIVRVIEYINSRSEEDLPNKHRLLETQLTIAFELYMSIRHEMDSQWAEEQRGCLYLQFCDMVVTNYQKEKNVNYYARALGYDPRYFSKIFCSFSGGISPLEWIGNYVVSQAKKQMDANPKIRVKELANLLGFPDTAAFCRYFKRHSGINPKDYKQSITAAEA